MLVPNSTKKIQVTCPICKTRDIVGIPERTLKENTHLITVSIHKGLICPHHFQLFIDKNLRIRGYQKVDLELNKETSIKLRNGVIAYSKNDNESKTPFKVLIYDNSTFKTIPKIRTKDQAVGNITQEGTSKSKIMSLKELYEEFWEFIDEKNKIFHDFITNDKRRRKSLLSSNLNRLYNPLEVEQEF